GATVSDPLVAAGGVPPYTWSATHLPGGVSIDPSTGTISGSPILPRGWSLPLNSNYSFTAQVRDSVGQTATTSVSWTISPTFSYTRSATGTVVPNNTTVHFQGTYGIDVCTGDPGGAQIIILANTSRGLANIGGFTKFSGQPVDETLGF